MSTSQPPHSPAALRKSRFVQAFFHSDLLGVPITLAFCAIFAASLGTFYLAGNLGGLVFIVLAGGLLGLFLTIDGRNAPESLEGLVPAGAAGRHRVLVVANAGLNDAALCAEVCQRGTRAQTEAMIIAPVVPSSAFHRLTDDIDSELAIAQERVDVAVSMLRSNGIEASGHPEIGDPMHSLLDGLRQFHATEVVMLNGGEDGWQEAHTFAERIRSEVGLQVTEVDPARSLVLH